jgi:Autotransporter beta-domain
MKHTHRITNALSHKATLWAVCAMACTSPMMAQAACNTLFEATVTTAGSTQQFCRDSLESLYQNAVRDVGNSFANYTENSAILTNGRLLGVNAFVSFDQGSRTLVFQIPGIGLSQTFTGATRRDSAVLLANFLRDNPSILGSLQNLQAATSPLSPIAGTGGVMSQAIFADFNGSFTDSATRIASSQSNASQGAQSVIGAGVLLSSHKVGDSTVRSATIPLSYTVRNDIDPRRQALVRAGFGVLDSAGSKSYQGRLSAGYRFPMSDNWVLTPIAGASLAGSRDAGFFVGVFNGSLASTYTWEFDSFDVTMGNMLGYYQTFKPPGGKFTTDPKIRNTAFMNGLLLSQPVSFGGSKMSIEYGISDTRLTGTTLYQKSAQEFTLSLGTNKNALSARSFLRGTLALQRSKDSKGVSLGVNYWF